MKLMRSCEISELNWGAVPELRGPLERLGVQIGSASAELQWGPDSITYDSLDEASRDAGEKGAPRRYSISVLGTREKKAFSLLVSRGINIHYEEYLYLSVSGISRPTEIESISSFLGLVPQEPGVIPAGPARTAFIAHRFDQTGTECADKLARFLELIGFKVVSGRTYTPGSVAAKVKSRIERQAVIFVLLTPGSDDTWLVQESTIGNVKEKPLIIIKDSAAVFSSGVLADYEYIPFDLPTIETTFIPILEGLRELGYLSFED